MDNNVLGWLGIIGFAGFFLFVEMAFSLIDEKLDVSSRVYQWIRRQHETP